MVAAGDGETQCSKVRSDVVRKGPSLRSQKTIGPCGLSSAEQEATIRFLRPFWRARSASTGGHQPSCPPLFREFFDEVAEFGQDEFFHREADGVF